jgi:hypothetical protein
MCRTRDASHNTAPAAIGATFSTVPISAGATATGSESNREEQNGLDREAERSEHREETAAARARIEGVAIAWTDPIARPEYSAAIAFQAKATGVQIELLNRSRGAGSRPELRTFSA